jgi:hypothetical protein
MMPWRTGDLLRLIEDLGRFNAGELFLYLEPMNRFDNMQVVLAPDGRKAGIPTWLLESANNLEIRSGAENG